jgi:hypothetical protein
MFRRKCSRFGTPTSGGASPVSKRESLRTSGAILYSPWAEALTRATCSSQLCAEVALPHTLERYSMTPLSERQLQVGDEQRLTGQLRTLQARYPQHPQGDHLIISSGPPTSRKRTIPPIVPSLQQFGLLILDIRSNDIKTRNLFTQESTGRRIASGYERLRTPTDCD